MTKLERQMKAITDRLQAAGIEPSGDNIMALLGIALETLFDNRPLSGIDICEGEALKLVRKFADDARVERFAGGAKGGTA